MKDDLGLILATIFPALGTGKNNFEDEKDIQHEKH